MHKVCNGVSGCRRPPRSVTFMMRANSSRGAKEAERHQDQGGPHRGSGAQHVKLGKDFVHPSAESYASLDSRLIDLVLLICRGGAISNLHQIVEGKGQSHMACLPFAGLLGGLLVHTIRGFLFCSPLIKVLEV